MLQIRRAEDRGHADHGWLNSYHTFSFADYHDPAHMGFRALRVINEDRVAPAKGFGTHAHRDMEILSYVLEGALQHRDSMGTGSTIHPGDVQRLSAGTGITHSEFNASPSEPVHFLQIWLLPDQPGIAPSYEQKTIASTEKEGRLRLVASPDGREGSVTIHAAASLYASILDPNQSLGFVLQPERHAWIQIVRGRVLVQGHELKAGDGAAISAESSVKLQGLERAELLLFELA